MERYREFRMRPWQDAARYLRAFLYLLATVIFVAFIVFSARVPARLAEHLRGALPDGTTFAIADGKLSVTGAEGRLDLGMDGMPFVVDTSIEGTADVGDVGAIDGLVIGRDAVFLVEEGTVVNAQDYSTLEDGVITKDDILSFLRAYGLLIAASGALMSAFFHMLFLVLNVAWFVVFGAWISTAVGRMWRIEMTYRQWVAVGLHAATLPILADHLFWGFSLSVPLTFPFLYFMIMIAVLLDERQSPVGKPADEAK